MPMRSASTGAGIWPARENSAALREARGLIPWLTNSPRTVSVTNGLPGRRPGNSQRVSPTATRWAALAAHDWSSRTPTRR
jgi:hypothetical protein